MNSTRYVPPAESLLNDNKKVDILSLIVISKMSKSCEYNATNAFIFNGNNGELNNNNKYNSNTVRPVSEFCYQNTDRAFLSSVSSMYFAYYICRKHKSGAPNAIHFERDLSANIHELSTQIWNGEYIPKPSIAFVVTRPCPRDFAASAFDERIVQHWVVWRLEPRFSKGDGRSRLSVN